MRMLTLAVMILVTGPSMMASRVMAQGGASKPTKEHEYLAKDLGTRTGTMKVWPQGPDAASMEISFSETNTSLLGGFWVESKLDAGPYKGHGMMGYDPVKKKYLGTWMNNMFPHLNVMEGTYDEAAHELTMTFDDYDAMTQKPTTMKSVTSDAPGKDSTMTMYKKDAGTGKWIKSFVMTYETK